jgi:hypothetical protein
LSENVPTKRGWTVAAAALALGESKAIAAKKAGISTKTVQRWLADEAAFADLVAEFRTAYIGESAGILAHASTSAARKLHQLVSEAPDMVALSAARTILAMADQYRAAMELEERIKALELEVGLKARSW